MEGESGSLKSPKPPQSEEPVGNGVTNGHATANGASHCSSNNGAVLNGGSAPESPPTTMPSSDADYETSFESVEEERLLKLMRANVLKLNPETKAVDDSTLRRFLRARQRKVDKATDMFMEHFEWRRTYVPLGYIPESEIVNELDAKKVFLQGRDKLGRPIGVIQACKHDAKKRNLEEFKRVKTFASEAERYDSTTVPEVRLESKGPGVSGMDDDDILDQENRARVYFKSSEYCVYNFDKCVASMYPGEEKFSVIVDLHGLAYKNLDPRGWTIVFDFLQAHYPERIGKIFLIHVPYIFWGAWKLVNKFIDKRTRDKILFVEDKHLEEVLTKEIDKDQLPKFCGGELDMVLIQDAPTPNWPQKKAASPVNP